MFRRLSLQSRMIALVTAVTFVMMSVIVWFDSYSLQKSVEETYISQLNGMTIAINGRYEESHSITDVQQIFDYIQYKNKNVLQLTLYGKKSVLAATDRERIGQPTPPAILQTVESGRTSVTHMRDEADGVPKDLLAAPLKEDGNTFGAIELLLDTTDTSKLVRERTTLIIAVGLAATLLLLFVLSAIIRTMLIRPLLRVREAALSVKQGQNYKDIHLDNASLEIREVASAFNEMVHNLEGRYNELEQAMNTIRQTQKQLVESEKMVALGNLVAGVSHEINTPLGIGVTAASYIDEKSKEFAALYESSRMKRSDLEEYLKTVRETTGMLQTNLARASELVKSFKQVAVDRSAQIRRSFNVKQYVQEVLVSLKPNLKRTKLQVSVQGSESAAITSDPGALSQIITNFIMNSIIHAYDADAEGTIRIDIAESETGVTIRYSDDGKGMPPEIVEQIFHPFFTTKRGAGGTGLGMHIVYNLVTQSLGGTIRCESEVGAGTTFTIHIPMSEGELS
ncbi:ATP-binding protein [Paenibacillus chartarius]|uniref:histidine kinase n=1 Tax=Paenibacillus chartarius TaxID=747481 RepID=A0ABV6DMX5_9BACL